ncbi:iron uptake system component EfeO [Reticulibacter mediterranei]|uniref:Iron uptake system component EfeO n=1 Tax=Reticulibacter mediterranei TaxID=2778369 RepID=A0A8J3ID47_9CHLR|nr:iron uptake system protein EfeO [Reticulibacter mediterranei]GHO91308.1 iron uptake system component EfeO [Reticulibacter mediterranei]
MRVLKGVLFLVCIGLLLTACGGQNSQATKSDTSKSTAITVNVHDNYFDPQNINVTPEQPVAVTFVNKGSNVHIVEILGLTAETTLQPGSKATFTITPQKRSYKMYDELYVSQGMQGAFSGQQATNEAKATATVAPNIQSAVTSYRDYVKLQTGRLLTNTQAFVDAINAGDMQKAKDMYGKAREGYERIEPIASALGDLDPRLDAREGDVPNAQWTGFHRIEKSLWVDNTTKGLEKYTQQLLGDVKALDQGVDKLELKPIDIIDGAVELLNEASHSKIQGEEDRYSHTDLYDLSSNVEGSQAAFIVFKNFLTEKNPAQYQDIQAKFQQVETTLRPFRSGDGFVPYDKLTTQDKHNIANAINTVAEALSKVAVNLPQS